MSLSPDGTLLAATERLEGAVRIWSVATGRQCMDPLPQDVPASPAWFSADGRRVLTVSNGSAQWHELWDFDGPAPSWLPDLAEAVGGLTLSDNGVAVPLQSQVGALARARASIAASGDNPIAQWGRWFFAERPTR